MFCDFFASTARLGFLQFYNIRGDTGKYIDIKSYDKPGKCRNKISHSETRLPPVQSPDHMAMRHMVQVLRKEYNKAEREREGERGKRSVIEIFAHSSVCVYVCVCVSVCMYV